MMRRVLASLAAVIAFAVPIAVPAQSNSTGDSLGTFRSNEHWDLSHRSQPARSGSLATFDSEDAAHAHCPSDIVVWLNTNSGIWHLKGERWYAKTKHGAYVCEHEAAKAGDRETHNGQ